MKLFEKIPNPREIRRKLGLNQQEFWSRIGVTQSGGSRYESGRNMPKPVRELLRLVHVEQIDLSKVRREDFEIVEYLKETHPPVQEPAQSGSHQAGSPGRQRGSHRQLSGSARQSQPAAMPAGFIFHSNCPTSNYAPRAPKRRGSHAIGLVTGIAHQQDRHVRQFQHPFRHAAH